MGLTKPERYGSKNVEFVVTLSYRCVPVITVEKHPQMALTNSAVFTGVSSFTSHAVFYFFGGEPSVL